jgi:NDP-sugar pyrophosphorylase family protein
VTDLDLSALVATHGAGARDLTSEPVGKSVSLATLAVQDRVSSRKLLFDGEGLFGRLFVESGREERARSPRGRVRAFAFSGVHVVSPELISRLPDDEVFSITDHYLTLAAAGERIEPYDIGAAAWWEIGTPERLAGVRRALSGGPGESWSPDRSPVGGASPSKSRPSREQSRPAPGKRGD